MLLVGGENLFDLISETSNGDLTYKAIPGGSPYNTAIAAGLLGAETAYISPISSDQLGQALVDYLTHTQVQHLGDRVEAPTSLALVNLNQGQASYQFYREQSAERQIDLHRMQAICQQVVSSEQSKQQQAILHIGSLALTGEKDGELWCQLFEWAQSTMFCSVDLNIRPQFIENELNYRQRLERIINSAHLIKLSDEDLCWWLRHDLAQSSQIAETVELDESLSEERIIKSANEFLHTSQAQFVIVTQGSKGSHLFIKTPVGREASSLFYPAFKTDSLQDTVGAGDTFMGAFLAQIQGLRKAHKHEMNTSDLESALAFSSMAAMINCERSGCKPPMQNEVYNRLKTDLLP